MLENSLFESQGRRQKTRKPLTVVISVAAHVVTIAVLVLIPLLQTQAITIPPPDISLWAPKAEAPRIVEIVSVQPRIQRSIQPEAGAFVAPEAIPAQIFYIDEPVSPIAGLLPSSETSPAGSLLRDLFLPGTPETGAAPPLPPPTPPPPPPVVKAEPVRIGGDVQLAKVIHQVTPVYPALARQTRVQGAVQLEAVIGKDGTIQSLRVVSGHPFLAQAALDAVKQWRYRPTLLNGEPVEVITTVTVTFTFR